MPSTVLGVKSGGFISGSGSNVLLPFSTDQQTAGLLPSTADVFLQCDKALTAIVEFSPDGLNWLPAIPSETTVANVVWLKSVMVPDVYMRLSITSTTTSSTYHARVVVRGTPNR